MRAVVENTRVCFPSPGPAVSRRIVPLESPCHFIHNQADTESRLHGGSSKQGKARRSVTSFKLCHSIFPTVCCRPVEASQLVIQNPHKNYVNLGGAGGKSIFHGERRRLVLRVQGDLRSLGDPAQVIVVSSKLISAAFSMIVEAGCTTWTSMVSSAENDSFARSGAN